MRHASCLLAVHVAVGAILGACAAPARAPQPATEAALAFVHVRVFDGRSTHDDQTVVVAGGVVVAMGAEVAAPAGARRIDGAGKTLMPGMIDSHAHFYPGALEEALAFGVTTEIDMMSSPEAGAAAKARERRGEAGDAAELRLAGVAATAPGGHGTEYGVAIPTITETTDLEAWVTDRLREGSDHIKIIDEHGVGMGRPIPSLDADAIARLIKVAHAHRVKAIVHIGSRREAVEAIEAGADGLAHLFVDEAPGPDFCPLAAARRAFLVPTLSVLESSCGTPSGAGLVGDRHLDRFLTVATRGNLAAAFPAGTMARCELGHALATTAACRARGVAILAGTDAPNPGTAHGASIHRELELLVRAGLTPAQALEAATAAPAAAFALDDRGRIAPGRRADLVLVDGDPTRDITASRAIVGVWKRGVPADRARLGASAAAFDRAYAAGIAGGLISDFETGQLDARFGLGFSSQTDAMMGGASSAALSIVASDGRAGSRRALRVEGRVEVGASGYGYASALFNPGFALNSVPVDLSSKRGVGLFARGDGGAYGVCVFRKATGYVPSCRPFVAGPAWAAVSFSWAELGGGDGGDVTGISISASASPGAGVARAYWVELDEVRLLD